MAEIIIAKGDGLLIPIGALLFINCLPVSVCLHLYLLDGLMLLLQPASVKPDRKSTR